MQAIPLVSSFVRGVVTRKRILGLLLVLALVLALPAAGAEGPTLGWPSFDLIGWIADWLGISDDGSSGQELGGVPEPYGLEVSPSGPTAEIGPGLESGGGEEPPTGEIGPTGEPNG